MIDTPIVQGGGGNGCGGVWVGGGGVKIIKRSRGRASWTNSAFANGEGEHNLIISPLNSSLFC